SPMVGAPEGHGDVGVRDQLLGEHCRVFDGHARALPAHEQWCVRRIAEERRAALGPRIELRHVLLVRGDDGLLLRFLDRRSYRRVPILESRPRFFLELRADACAAPLVARFGPVPLPPAVAAAAEAEAAVPAVDPGGRSGI